MDKDYSLGKELIKQASGGSFWSVDTLKNYIKKPFSVDWNGNIVWNKEDFTEAEIQAIEIAAAMEKGMMRG